jgi:hypothetical protein
MWLLIQKVTAGSILNLSVLTRLHVEKKTLETVKLNRPSVRAVCDILTTISNVAGLPTVSRSHVIFQSGQTGYGAHRISYANCAGGALPWDKAAETWNWPLTSIQVTKLRMCGAVPSYPHTHLHIMNRKNYTELLPYYLHIIWLELPIVWSGPTFYRYT